MLEFWDGIDKEGIVYTKMVENKKTSFKQLLPKLNFSPGDRTFIENGPTTTPTLVDGEWPFISVRMT